MLYRMCDMSASQKPNSLTWQIALTQFAIALGFRVLNATLNLLMLNAYINFHSKTTTKYHIVLDKSHSHISSNKTPKIIINVIVII